MKLLFKQLVLEFCQGGAPSAQEQALDSNDVPLWLTGRGHSIQGGKINRLVERT
ncbi:hypothetical protein [Microseira sp. BLCC-F43]|uniref:hypothetical protein n=1 Tax=Microseira sp. BLCC-F43 TaxID=3153602 RepID=UPI0035BA9DF6